MSHDTLTRILMLARWAPSGDNTQPWRFEVVSDHLIRVHGFDTRDHVLYDYERQRSEYESGYVHRRTHDPVDDLLGAVGVECPVDRVSRVHGFE